MLEPRLRFIDLATRPLSGKGTAEELARGELMDRLAHARPAAGDDSLDVATAALERVQAGSRWRSAAVSWLAVGLLWGALIPVFRAAWMELERLDAVHSFFGHTGEAFEKWSESLTVGMDPNQRFFVLANTYGVESEEQKRWIESGMKHLPEEPAEFEEFVSAVWRIRGRFSKDFQEHGEKIDPGNGLWAMMEASSINWNTRPGARRAGAKPAFVATPEYQEAVDLLQKAADQPRIESSTSRRTSERLLRFGPAEDLASMADLRRFASYQRRFRLDSTRLNDLWTERATELAGRNDPEGLRKWIGSWDHMMMQSLRTPYRAGGIGPGISVIARAARDLKKTAGTAGLTDVESRMQQWMTEMGKPLSGHARHGLSGREKNAATFAAGEWQYYFPDLATAEELTSGRMAEHAGADRFFALAGAGFFGLLAAFATFEAWRRSAPVRGLASGVFPLLRPVDFAWLAGLGIILPLVWHVVVVRFTPLGCRDLGLMLWDMLPQTGQAGGGFLFSVCLLVQTARWRLAKRGGVIGLCQVSLWPGWVLAVLAALFIPAMGIVRYFPKWEEEQLAMVAAVAGLPFLWLLWRGFALLFGPRHAALGGVVMCRALVPCFIAAAVLLLGLMPLLKNEERRWIALDSVCGADSAGSGRCVLDARADELVRAQLLKAME